MAGEREIIDLDSDSEANAHGSVNAPIHLEDSPVPARVKREVRSEDHPQENRSSSEGAPVARPDGQHMSSGGPQGQSSRPTTLNSNRPFPSGNSASTRPRIMHPPPLLPPYQPRPTPVTTITHSFNAPTYVLIAPGVHATFSEDLSARVGHTAPKARAPPTPNSEDDSSEDPVDPDVRFIFENLVHPLRPAPCEAHGITPLTEHSSQVHTGPEYRVLHISPSGAVLRENNINVRSWPGTSWDLVYCQNGLLKFNWSHCISPAAQAQSAFRRAICAENFARNPGQMNSAEVCSVKRERSDAMDRTGAERPATRVKREANEHRSGASQARQPVARPSQPIVQDQVQIKSEEQIRIRRENQEA